MCADFINPINWEDTNLVEIFLQSKFNDINDKTAVVFVESITGNIVILVHCKFTTNSVANSNKVRPLEL